LSNPDEATKEFFKREFPEILESNNKTPHDAIFVPDSFLFGDITEKVCSAIKKKFKNKSFFVIDSLIELRGNKPF
jgi:hypothetical protein